MNSGLIGVIYTINQEETMDHINKVVTWAKANKQKSVIIALAVIAIIFLLS